MKDAIISSSINYLANHDLDTFTLELAAREAGVSKGGLLHHFKNKQALLEAIANRIFDNFRERMNKLALSHTPPLSVTQSLIVASTEDLLASANFNIAFTIMEKINSNLSKKYEGLTQELYQDDLENETSLLIRLTIDGLYYSRYLDLAPVSQKETEAILDRLYQLTERRS